MIMRESAEVCETAPELSPDIAATAEVLRCLYLPHECRHLVQLLQPAAGAPDLRPGGPAPASGCPGWAEPRWPAAVETTDAAFLDAVQTLLATASSSRVQGDRLGELRDTLQIRTWFLDALQDELRQSRAGGGAPRVPGREELAARLRDQQARYAPDAEPDISPAIRQQLRGR